MRGRLPVAVIGAGPVGLAAAAHLLRRGEEPIVLEAGPEAGHSVRQWGHVRMFSPWRYCTDPAAAALLEAAGWTHPDPDEVPTGRDLVERYLAPLAALPALRPRIRLGARVTAVGRKDFDKLKTAGRERQPFTLRVERADGREDEIEARAVIDASGTWEHPNPLGAGGLPVPGEEACRDRIAHGIPDVLGRERGRYAGRVVMVVGSGHSAINLVLDLMTLQQDHPGTRILWAIRRDDIESVFGGGAADALPARGELGLRARAAVGSGRLELLAPFRIRALERAADGKVRVGGVLRDEPRTVAIDEIAVATGFRPDYSFLREIRLSLDPWLESAQALGPLIDPNLHSCGTVPPHGARELAHPEAGFYIVGMKSYGRAPTFLLMTGHEQARSVAAAIAGDHAAAARVELVLPETGVCGAGPALAAGAGCCGAPEPVPVAALQSEQACCDRTVCCTDDGPKAEETCGCDKPACCPGDEAVAAGRPDRGAAAAPTRARPSRETGLAATARCCG